jgi:hypothetical protein
MEFLRKGLDGILIDAVLHAFNQSNLFLWYFSLVDYFGVLPRPEIISQTIDNMHWPVQLPIKRCEGKEIATYADSRVNQMGQAVQTMQGHATALRKAAYDKFPSCFLCPFTLFLNDRP